MSENTKDKIVYFVRHGETVGNVNQVVQDGSYDLSDSGHHQAARLAERLQSVSFDTLLSSSHTRALQTAQPISELTGIAIEPADLFIEVRRPSVFVGMSRDSKEYKSFLQAEVDHYGTPTWRHSDEENTEDLLQRIAEAGSALEEREGDILVVSHARFLRSIVLYLLAQKTYHPTFWAAAAKNFFIANTSITTLKYQAGEWKLITFNDHAHFAE